MKIKIDRRTFAQALSEVAPFASPKAPIAILKNAKFTTKGNRMKIEANDTQCSIAKYIEVIESDEDGSFLIDISDLNRFVAKTKGDTIEMDIDGTAVKVRHSKGSAEFATADAKEFPAFKMSDSEVTDIFVSPDLISDAVSKGRGFVANDTLRPMMNAIYAYIKDGQFGYCATDTNKLIHGYSGCETSNRDTDVHWLIMPSVFPALLNACKNAEEVKISITPTHVSYTIGNVRLQTVQAKGNYPNFKRVIPQTWGMECAVDKTEIADSLSRLMLFCDASECVKMDVSRMDMTLSADNLDFMKSSKENITHLGCDGEIKIGVNASKLMACVSVFNNGEIILRMSDPARPILLNSHENENLQVIVMPLQLVNG